MDILAFLAVIIVLWVIFAPIVLAFKMSSLQKRHEELKANFNQLSKSHKALLRRELKREQEEAFNKPISALHDDLQEEKPQVVEPPKALSEIEEEPSFPIEPTPLESKIPDTPEPIEEEPPAITLGKVSMPEPTGVRKGMYNPAQKKPQSSPGKAIKKDSAPSQSKVTKPQAPSWLTLVGDNWLGIAGATVLVLGLVFLGVYAASNFGPAQRFIMLLGVGGLLIGGGFFLRKKEAFKPAVGYLRASGGAVWLFACLGAGGLPGLQFIQEPLMALGVLLIGVIVNLYLGFFGKTQAFSALHVVLSLFALGAAQHFAGRGEIALFGAGLLVSAYGIALSFRYRWPWHLLILAVGYTLFHGNWILYATDFFDLKLNLIQNIAGGGGTALVAVLAALTHYQPRYQGSSKLGLPGRIHGINWLLALINIVPHSLGGKIAPFALTGAGIALFVLARYARKLNIRWLYLTDTVVALLLLCSAALSLARLDASPFIILLLLVFVLVAASWLFYKEKEGLLAVITQAGLAVVGFGSVIYLISDSSLNSGIAEVVMLSLAAICGLAWLSWVNTQKGNEAKSNPYYDVSRRFALITLALLLPAILMLGEPLLAMIILIVVIGIGMSIGVQVTQDKALSFANIAAIVVAVPVLFLVMAKSGGRPVIEWLLPLLSFTTWPLAAAFLHPDRKASSGLSMSSIVAGLVVSLLLLYYFNQSWVTWLGAVPLIAMRLGVFRKQWNGLVSGVVIMLVSLAALGLYHVAVIHQDFSTIDYVIFCFPLLLVTAVEAFTSEKSQSLPYPKWIWIYLTGATVLLASFLILRPISGLLPGISWLAMVPVIIVAAKQFETRLAGRHKHLLVMAGVVLLAFLARHLTIHLGSSLYLAEVPIRAIIGLTGVAVMAYLLVFERNKDWDEIYFWKKGHALLLETAFLLFVITLAFEMKVPYWQPIAWSALAIVSIMLGTLWKEGSRLRLYGLLSSWAAAFQIAVLSSVAILPTSSIRDTPWFTAVIGLGMLIGFVVIAYRLLKLDQIEFPFDLASLQRLLTRLQKRPLPWLVLPVSIGAAIFFYFAFEKSQLTLLWMVEALVLFALAIFLREPYFRYISLAIVVVCMVRLPLFDLTNASLLGRALSFIGVGAMLMAMDLIYRKFGSRVKN